MPEYPAPISPLRCFGMGKGDKGAASSRRIIPPRPKFIPVNQLRKQRARGHRLLVRRFITAAGAFNCPFIQRLTTVCAGFAQKAPPEILGLGGGLPLYFIILSIPIIPPYSHHLLILRHRWVGKLRHKGAGGNDERQDICLGKRAAGTPTQCWCRGG